MRSAQKHVRQAFKPFITNNENVNAHRRWQLGDSEKKKKSTKVFWEQNKIEKKISACDTKCASFFKIERKKMKRINIKMFEIGVL